MIQKLLLLAAVAMVLGIFSGSAKADAVSIISSNFNGTPIQGGSTIWFSSHMKVNGLGAQPTTIFISNSAITFSAGGQLFNLTTPNAQITFDPAATHAVTSFDSSTNTWV